jgi:hypothetical protein
MQLDLAIGFVLFPLSSSPWRSKWGQNLVLGEWQKRKPSSHAGLRRRNGRQSASLARESICGARKTSMAASLGGRPSLPGCPIVFVCGE